MAEMHIGAVNSTVRATDPQGLLSPQVLDQIVRAVLARLRDEQERQMRAEADRRLRQGVFDDRSGSDWS
jgi:hypothetical protein